MTDAIDIHNHFNGGGAADSPVDDAYRCDPDFLKAEYDACHIRAGCFSSFSAVCSAETVCEENARAEALARRLPWFYQWAVVCPLDERTFEQADRLLKTEKCVGVKIHAGYHGYSLQRYGDRIFSFAAQRGAVVLMHPDELSVVPAFANNYADCRIIVAHLGGEEHIRCVESARHGNVYTDTSGSASLQNNLVEYAVSRLGAQRILFGTDTYSCAAQRGRIELSRLRADEKRAILRDNALRLFPKLGAACSYI